RRPGGVDRHVEDAPTLEREARNALDVDPGVAERLSQCRERPRTILEHDLEVSRHRAPPPRPLCAVYSSLGPAVKPKPGYGDATIAARPAGSTWYSKRSSPSISITGTRIPYSSSSASSPSMKT